MRHAILIMAHGDTTVLERCLSILDSPYIDFYIHMDAKNKEDYSYLKTACSTSRVILTRRIPVYWADYSQIEAELILIEAAVKNDYDYYHLISGMDLPLKTPEEFNQFFEEQENKGFEFIKPFATSEAFEENKLRVTMRYPFIRIIKRGNNKYINLLQKSLFTRILRFRKPAEKNIVKQLGWNVYIGENWFSITHAFAEYLLQSKGIIEQYFSDGYTADEVFAITILKNSVFKDRLGKAKTRLIDWERGKPYVWRMSDKDQLLSSQHLFARKFDVSVDSGIVGELSVELLSRKQDE